jgi:hypothetical protein
MLMLSTLFKNHTITTTSVIALGLHILILFIFYGVYRHNVNEFTLVNTNTGETIDKKHMWYYALVTHSTLGYGDVLPKTNKGRMLVSIHVFLVIILVGFFGSN